MTAILTPHQINEKYSIKNKDWKFYHNSSSDLCDRIKLVIPTSNENTTIYKYEGVHGHYERINKTYESPDDFDPWGRQFKTPPSSVVMVDCSNNKIVSNKIIRGFVRTTSVEGNLIYCVDYLWIHESDANLNFKHHSRLF